MADGMHFGRKAIVKMRRLTKEELERIKQEVINETNQEVRRQLRDSPDWLKMFEEMEESRHRRDARDAQISRAIQGSYKVRFEVLKRDGFRCQYCGRSPKNDETVVLHVDHIIPKSRGGAFTKDNLTTACSVCNVGKGNMEL